MIARIAASLGLALSPAAAAAEAGFAPPELSWFEWAPFDETCGGECAAGVFAGKWIDSAMSEMFAYGSDGLLPPWEWAWREDYVLGVQVSRRVARVFDLIDLEGEVGAAIRGGEGRANEVWIAGYARWTEFPWNHAVRTSFAINTGLNYADRVTPVALARSKTPGGSRLLHYLAPEITVAPAWWETTDLFVRFHHRSGGAQIWGDSALFNNVSGEAQYWTLGIRTAF